MANAASIFKNLGHYFAVAVSKLPLWAAKADFVAQSVEIRVDEAAPTVEAVSAIVPVYGPEMVNTEKAGAMALGAIVSVFHVLGGAARAKLLDIGLDETAVATVEDVYSKLPSEVKAMVAAK